MTTPHTLPSPASPVYFRLFVVLLAADATTTLIGLHLGAAEGNILLRWLFSHTGVYAGLCISRAAGLLMALLLYLYCQRRHHNRRVYRNLCIIIGVVAASNCWTIAKLLLVNP